MSSDKGYIKVYRDIWDHWIWDDKPFSMNGAWIDLLMLANHEDKTILFNKKPVSVKRGSFITSMKKLGDRWGWGRKKVKTFLDLLKKEDIVTLNIRTGVSTTINIVNYGLYQDFAKHKGTTQEQPRNSSGTTKEQPGNINNTLRNTKEDTKKKNPQTPFSDQADEKQKMEELYPAEEGWYDP